MKEKKRKTKDIIDLKKLISLILVATLIVLIEYILPKEEETGENQITQSSTENVQNENIKIEDIPEYSGQIVISINNDTPYFEEKDIVTEDFEYYSNLDELGRGGQAFANICKLTMPKERCKKRKPLL